MSSSLHRVAIVAALSLAVAGTVHLVDAPDTFGDATYLGPEQAEEERGWRMNRAPMRCPSGIAADRPIR